MLKIRKSVKIKCAFIKRKELASFKVHVNLVVVVVEVFCLDCWLSVYARRSCQQTSIVLEGGLLFVYFLLNRSQLASDLIGGECLCRLQRFLILFIAICHGLDLPLSLACSPWIHFYNYTSSFRRISVEAISKFSRTWLFTVANYALRSVLLADDLSSRTSL